jgi:hypothetical protein
MFCWMNNRIDSNVFSGGTMNVMLGVKELVKHFAEFHRRKGDLVRYSEGRDLQPAGPELGQQDHHPVPDRHPALPLPGGLSSKNIWRQK